MVVAEAETQQKTEIPRRTSDVLLLDYCLGELSETARRLSKATLEPELSQGLARLANILAARSDEPCREEPQPPIVPVRLNVIVSPRAFYDWGNNYTR